MTDKLSGLQSILGSLGSVVVAYSGGVDSTLLAAVAHQVLGEKALAVTAASPTYPQAEVEAAADLARSLGLRHMVIQTQEMEDPCFLANGPFRCYYCKRELFQELQRIARMEGLQAVAEGSTLDDTRDYRPGRKAAQELGVRSPLLEAGLTKEEVRALSRRLGLPTWDKPALACLASRIPYGTPLRPELLQQVEKAEAFLQSLGLRQVRVRHHDGMARIEVEPEGLPLLVERREAIIERLRQLGYTYVTADLAGYRPGSLNQLLRQGEGAG